MKYLPVETEAITAFESVVLFAPKKKERQSEAGIKRTIHTIITSNFDYAVTSIAHPLINIQQTQINSYFTKDISVIGNIIEQIKLLNIFFQFENLKQTNSFFFKNPEIVTELFKLHTEIISLYGPVMPILTVILDAEIEDWETLFVKVPGNHEEQVNENYNLLMDWLVKQPKVFRKSVTITV